MYELNGIVYAGEPIEGIEIKAVQPLDDMMMLLTFSTGERRNLMPLFYQALHLHRLVTTPLTIFRNCKIVNGVVTWDNEEIDCAPEYMYEHSYSYPGVGTAV